MFKHYPTKMLCQGNKSISDQYVSFTRRNKSLVKVLHRSHKPFPREFLTKDQELSSPQYWHHWMGFLLTTQTFSSTIIHVGFWLKRPHPTYFSTIRVFSVICTPTSKVSANFWQEKLRARFLKRLIKSI